MFPTRRPYLFNKLVLMSLGILVLLLGSIFLFIMPIEVTEEREQALATYSVYEQDSLLPRYIITPRDVTIGEYFDFMDSIVSEQQGDLTYIVSEHLLVHANPWIIDTLANTDYYRMIARDSFVYDQKKLQLFRSGDSLKIPSLKEAENLSKFLDDLRLDINIPEFTLRILLKDSILYTFPIRVGQNKEKYLAMGNRLTDLKTITGSGSIVRHAKDPDFYNPVTHQPFYTTKRDDERRTMMPQIPWIETEINGIRNGQMIHPTTNPKTLGKAYSNGCIGTKEADGWVIYYHAPLGTPISIRYELYLANGDILPDIYNKKRGL